MIKRRSPLAVVTLVLLLLCSWAFLATDSSSAQSVGSQKMSPELHLLSGTGGHVSVIVQPATTWNPLLDSLVSDLNGVLVGTMQNLPLRVISLPVDQLDELVARSEIRYVSLDRDLKAFGHVTQTTGTDAGRTEGDYIPPWFENFDTRRNRCWYRGD